MREKDIDHLRRPRDIDRLTRLLGDPDEIIRMTAAEALGAVGDDRALEPLRRLKFADPDADVRRAASLAHAQVAEKKDVEGMHLKTWPGQRHTHRHPTLFPLRHHSSRSCPGPGGSTGWNHPGKKHIYRLR
ncbi:MAG: HEAT repeat domain-containing protein [Candidatus Methanoculleus thermohydrogenotrophicum]|jgi:hypothetical protein